MSSVRFSQGDVEGSTPRLKCGREPQPDHARLLIHIPSQGIWRSSYRNVQRSVPFADEMLTAPGVADRTNRLAANRSASASESKLAEKSISLPSHNGNLGQANSLSDWVMFNQSNTRPVAVRLQTACPDSRAVDFSIFQIWPTRSPWSRIRCRVASDSPTSHGLVENRI